MIRTAIFWPMIAHVVLVYLVLWLLTQRRGGAVRAGEAKWPHFREREAEPSASITAYNNLVNQFEFPVLFYAACLALFVTNGANIVVVALAWLFVVLRYLHAAIHLGGNQLRPRGLVFAFGAAVLGAIWMFFALHLLGLT